MQQATCLEVTCGIELLVVIPLPSNPILSHAGTVSPLIASRLWIIHQPVVVRFPPPDWNACVVVAYVITMSNRNGQLHVSIKWQRKLLATRLEMNTDGVRRQPPLPSYGVGAPPSVSSTVDPKSNRIR